MKRAMATFLLLLAAHPATATIRALPEEILCSQEAAFVATVIDARSHDCGLIRGHCDSHFVGLTLRVEEVLSRSRGDFHVGDRVRAGFRVLDAPPMRISKDVMIPMNIGGDGGLGFPVTKGRISDEAARAEFMGKRFVAAIKALSRMKHRGQRDADAAFAAEVAEPNYGLAYPPSDEAWVRATWTTRCPGWLR